MAAAKLYPLVPLLAMALSSGCLLDRNTSGVSTRGDDLAISFMVIDKFGLPADQFIQGDQATFRILYRNTTDSKLSLDFTAPGYVIGLVDKNSGNTVWTANYGLFYAQVIGKFDMDPYETKTEDIKWNLTSNEGATPGESSSGAPLPIGSYQAKFSGYYGGVTFDLAPLDIRIE